jgi:hypothetical protein
LLNQFIAESTTGLRRQVKKSAEIWLTIHNAQYIREIQEEILIRFAGILGTVQYFLVRLAHAIGK